MALSRASISRVVPKAGMITTSSAVSSSKRSEERRVGKEGRSLCDWSSDVCSSDLVAFGLKAYGIESGLDLQGRSEGRYDHDVVGGEFIKEIGRASCRERG